MYIIKKHFFVKNFKIKCEIFSFFYNFLKGEKNIKTGFFMKKNIIKDSYQNNMY